MILSQLSQAPLWLRLLIAALATWRLSSLFVNKNEEGPGKILHRIRDWAGAYELGDDDEPLTSLGRLFACIWCMSVWVGLCVSIIVIMPFWGVLIPFALSATAILIKEIAMEHGNFDIGQIDIKEAFEGASGTHSTIVFPEPKSTLLMNGSSVMFNFREKKPNRWYRFWQRVLLGWVWKDYK